MTPCPHGAGPLADLYYYGELSPAARAHFEDHLAACPACRGALEDLGAIRSALDGRAVASPPAGEWAPFMARLDARLRLESQRGRGWRTPVLASLAAAALLVLAVLTGTFLTGDREILPPSAAPGTLADPQTGLASAAAQHFGRTKVVLLGLLGKGAAGTSDDWAYEQGLASSLLPETTLYRLAAEQQGLTRLVDVLTDLELVLLQASAGDGRDPETLDRVQDLIRRRDVMMKLELIVAQPVAAGRTT